MNITVALDGSLVRNLQFFPGDEVTINLTVYENDGDTSALTYTNPQMSVGSGDLYPIGTEFTIPLDIGRTSYRLAVEIGGVITTVAYGYIETAVAGSCSVVCDCLPGGSSSTSDIAGTYTWSTVPDADNLLGRRVRVSDYGIYPGLIVVSNGVRWVIDGPQVLARSHEQVAAPANTSENILAAITVPGGLLGDDGTVAVTDSVWSSTSSANNKNIRARLGGISGTLFGPGVTMTNVTTGRLMCNISNRGTPNANIGASISSRGIDNLLNTIAPVTGTVDTTVAQTLVLTGQKASSGETLALESYTVMVYP